MIIQIRGGEIMDTKKLVESLDFSEKNIYRQALVYSFSNIFTLSMLSDFGISCKFSKRSTEDILEKLNKEFEVEAKENNKLQDPLSSEEAEKNLEDKSCFSIDKDFSFFNDLSPIQAVYSKTTIKQSSEDEFEEKGNLKFTLGNKSLERKLSPKNQGLLITNEINLARLLHDKSVIRKNSESYSTEKFIGLIMLDLAINQAIFAQKHLRNDDGIFVEKEDFSSSSDELHLEEVDTEISWEDQSYMLFAYALLYKVLKEPKFKRYFDPCKADYFKEWGLELLSIIKKHEIDVINLKTSSLSSFIASLVESLNILDVEHKSLSFVLSLCDELYAREKEKGFILYDKHAKEAASLATHFKSIEALSSGFEYTNYNLFLKASEDIYNNLNSIWDENFGLFKLDDADIIKYSSKSISYVLKSLNKLLKSTNSPYIKKSIEGQLGSFFDASINGADLQSPPPSLRMDLNMFRSSDSASIAIENMVEDENIYLIEKGFEINSNSQINKYSEEFSSEHLLFASDAMLNLVMEESSSSKASGDGL